jgi:hypothetical protein
LVQKEKKKEKEKKENTYVKRLSVDKQKENVETMLKRTQDLIFVSPILEGFSLKAKLWRTSYLSIFQTSHYLTTNHK